jgi:hypothetical protein
MTYIARPPLYLGQGPQGPLWSQVRRIFAGLWRDIWQTVTPFNPQPETPEDPPPVADISDEQLKQCQNLYDKVEDDRAALESKARATFSVVTFLVPLLASIFVFIFARSAEGSRGRTIVLILIGISSVFLLLGFISIARAVSVQVRQTLGLAAIIDLDAHAFRTYSKVFHARGLLFCASVNQAMNDHIAQFVRGAHILTAIAVIILTLAALSSVGSLPADSGPTKIQTTGPIEIASPALANLEKEVAKIDYDLRAAVDSKTQGQRLDALATQINQVADSVKKMQDELQYLRSVYSGATTRHKRR